MGQVPVSLPIQWLSHPDLHFNQLRCMGEQNMNRCSRVAFLNQDNLKILTVMRQQRDVKRQQYLFCLSDFIYLFKELSAWAKIEFRLQTILQPFHRLIHQLDFSLSYSYSPVAKCDSVRFCVRYEVVFNEMEEMTQRQMFLFQFTQSLEL